MNLIYVMTIFSPGTHFYDYLHPTMLQKGISEFLLTSLFTDVDLIVHPTLSISSAASAARPAPAPVRFPAHRIVVSVKCRILRQLFEENPEQREFHMQHITDPHILFLFL